MNKNIILAGVGGQGILTLAAIIDLAAMRSGLQIKQAEVHGMSQRGGAVQSHLRISDKEIFSDLIPLGKADLILSLEALEAFRYLPFLSEQGILISATDQVRNIPDYPDVEKMEKEIREKGLSCLFVKAGDLAKEAGSQKTENVVMAGVASAFLDIPKKSFEESIQSLFASKGEEMVSLNLAGFHLGCDLAMQYSRGFGKVE